MSKTSKNTQTQQIDPTLAKESHSLINLLRLIGSQEHQVNRGVTIAGLTPKQKAGLAASDSAAAAFGMQPSGRDAMPATQRSASGIEGYSIAPEYDKSKSLLPKEFRAAMDDWRSQFGTQTKEQKFKSGGGKK